MSKTKVNEKAVFAICNRIYIETGKDPRYEDLTSELNCSNSTVKPFFDSWLALPRLARHPMSEDLADFFECYAQAIWGRAQSAAMKAILPDKEQVEADFARCREQLTSALEIVEQKEGKILRMQSEIRGLLQQLAEVRVKLEMTAATSARFDELGMALNSMRQERDAANARASDALGQVTAHERHIEALLNSIRIEPAGRRTSRERPPSPAKDARG